MKKIIFLLLLTFFFCSPKIASEAAENSFNPGGDLSRYDTEWSEANVEYWSLHYHIVFNLFGDRTYTALRITNEDGELINNITRIEATFYVGDKFIYTCKDRMDGDTFTSSEVFSKEGKFTIRQHLDDRPDSWYKEKFPNYQTHNFDWIWNFEVRRFQTLYIWYIEDGKEVAGSMYDDAAHPKYSPEGEFLGFYNGDDELMEGYGIDSETGHLTTPEGQEVDLVGDQLEGEVSTTNPDKISGIFNSPDYSNYVKTIYLFVTVAACLIVAVLAFGIISKIYKFIR